MPETQTQSSWRRVLVLGGARSGKSAFAESYAGRLASGVIYVATAEARDAEMQQRIALHRATRSPDWITVEEPLWPSQAVRPIEVGCTLLLEDLTLLLSNHLLREGEGAGETGGAMAAACVTEVLREVAQLAEQPAHLVLVANEVGLGIVPEHPLGRVFRDAQGRVNQAVAASMSEVYLLVAGIPVPLKVPVPAPLL